MDIFFGSRRRSGIRFLDAKDKFHLCIPGGLAHRHRFCLHLCHDVCTDLGVRGLGVSTRDFQHEYAWSRDVDDDRH